ncbi:hypothetical protein AKJ09_02261 [Labilithrix luteola]|uniref:Uncharacterized protein n=2 Tax=Labilithrix luteola TaxID=1391654 RepID=A0A0K1PPZ9_9BACT|nr:hypothetical protein AKJ09_02261 [Labilithrix luteola]
MFVLLLAGCAGRPPERVVGTPVGKLSPRQVLLEDTAPKVELRMVPPEVYMRTYLQLFGGLSPIETQKKARGSDGNNLFDTWDDYVSSLGFPDYRLDVPRQTQTNALMVASFERLGIALCDRAVEHDLEGLGGKRGNTVAANDRVVFAFDAATTPMDEAQFVKRFDVLHRTFLGYPVGVAPQERTKRYFALYQDIVANHGKALPKSKFTPEQAGWAAICYGLVRHPEFHLY